MPNPAATPNTAKAPANLPDSIVRELAALLAHLTTAHETYLTLLAEHRDAIRLAKPALAAEVSERIAACLESIASLEQARRTFVQRIMDAGLWTSRQLITLSGLAERAGASRANLLDAASRLKALITTVQQEQAVLRRVTQSLSAHIEGIMRTVAKASSHAGTYGRRGIVGNAAVMTALDLNS